MEIKPPDAGFSFFLSWGIVEWFLAAIFGMGSAVAAWVWHLGTRIESLERRNHEQGLIIKNLEGETRQMQQMMRSLGSALDKKINEETHRLEERLEKVANKLEEIREELPSRSFIEGQLNNLGMRVDRAIEARSRPQP